MNKSREEGGTGEKRQYPQEPAEGADEAVDAHGAERTAEKEEVPTGDEARTAEYSREPAEGTEESVEAPGAGRTDEQPAGGEGTHEGPRDERAEEEVEKKPIAEDAGLVEDEEEGNCASTAQKTCRQPIDQEVRQQESTHHDEEQKDENKGLLDKVKDKLKGE